MDVILEQILLDTYPEYANLKNEDERDEFWSDLSERESYNVNAKFLKQTGNPKHNYLTCWEPGRLDDENESLFDYPTFYEFDIAWWEFQKQAQYESVEDYKKWMEEGSDHWTPERVAKSVNDLEDYYADGYKIYCSGDWFRLFEGERFIYSQMISAKWYIYYELESFLSELQDALIPYTLNESKHDFITLLNLDDPEEKYLANGREIELESLQAEIRIYSNEPLIEVVKLVMGKCNHSGATFRYDKQYEYEDFNPFTDYIFWDERSLQNVRTTHFVEDFKDNLLDNNIIEKLISEAKEMVKEDFMGIYDANRSRYIQE